MNKTPKAVRKARVRIWREFRQKAERMVDEAIEVGRVEYARQCLKIATANDAPDALRAVAADRGLRALDGEYDPDAAFREAKVEALISTLKDESDRRSAVRFRDAFLRELSHSSWSTSRSARTTGACRHFMRASRKPDCRAPRARAPRRRARAARPRDPDGEPPPPAPGLARAGAHHTAHAGRGGAR